MARRSPIRSTAAKIKTGRMIGSNSPVRRNQTLPLPPNRNEGNSNGSYRSFAKPVSPTSVFRGDERQGSDIDASESRYRLAHYGALWQWTIRGGNIQWWDFHLRNFEQCRFQRNGTRLQHNGLRLQHFRFRTVRRSEAIQQPDKLAAIFGVNHASSFRSASHSVIGVRA